MQRIGDEYTAQDPDGRAVPYATVAIYIAGTGLTVLAPAYLASDPLATPTTAITNPIVTDSLGRWRAALPDGRYDIRVSGGSFAPYIIPNVCVFDNTITYPSPMLGTVTSVAVAMPAEFATSAAITSSGTITVSYGTWAASKLIIAPTGGGTPTLRNLALLDLPAFGGGAGNYGTGALIPVVTVNAQGIPTGFATTTNTPAWSSVTGKPTSLGIGGYAATDACMCVFRQTASVTFGNTTTETTLIGAGSGSLQLAANQLVAGSTIRLRAKGTLGNVASTTWRFKLKLGANTIVDTTAVAMTPAPAPGSTFELEVAATVRTTGVGGTCLGIFVLHYATSASAAAIFPNAASVVTGTIDTQTGAQALDCTLQFGAAGANTTITVTNLQIFVEA